MHVHTYSPLEATNEAELPSLPLMVVPVDESAQAQTTLLQQNGSLLRLGPAPGIQDLVALIGLSLNLLRQLQKSPKHKLCFGQISFASVTPKASGAQIGESPAPEATFRRCVFNFHSSKRNCHTAIVALTPVRIEQAHLFEYGCHNPPLLALMVVHQLNPNEKPYGEAVAHLF